MKLSKQQTKALELMKAITYEMNTYEPISVNNPKWFHQAELPGITLHSMDALVNKGMIEELECKTTGHMYYRIKAVN